MVYYINIKFEPKIDGIKILNTKQKILHVTGPDAFTNGESDFSGMFYPNVIIMTV